MRYQPQAPLYVGILAGVVAASGCEKGSEAQQPPSQLESAVHATANVEGERLDLSSPESAYRAYVAAYNNQDFDIAEKVVSQAGTFPKLIANAKKKGRVSDHRVISDLSILKKEEVNEKKVILYTNGRVEGAKRENKVTMVYEETGWRLLSSSR